jgi:hypothetical protein
MKKPDLVILAFGKTLTSHQLEGDKPNAHESPQVYLQHPEARKWKRRLGGSAGAGGGRRGSTEMEGQDLLFLTRRGIWERVKCS